jgi:hypothetical protein
MLNYCMPSPWHRGPQVAVLHSLVSRSHVRTRGGIDELYPEPPRVNQKVCCHCPHKGHHHLHCRLFSNHAKYDRSLQDICGHKHQQSDASLGQYLERVASGNDNSRIWKTDYRNRVPIYGITAASKMR